MEVKAKLSFLRQSPKKVRLVVDSVRGMNAELAREQLQFTNKRAARPVLKLLESAIANARNNFNLKDTTLYIKRIAVDEGPTLKRYKPRAHGRATPIRKRTSHVSIVLDEKDFIEKKESDLAGNLDNKEPKIKNKKSKSDDTDS